MAKLVDMKMPKKSKKESMNMAVPSGPSDQYPYGLKIRLEEDEVKKLEGIMSHKPDTIVTIEAKGKIVSSRSEERAGGKKDRSVEIQITSICVEKGKGKIDKILDGNKRGYSEGSDDEGEEE